MKLKQPKVSSNRAGDLSMPNSHCRFITRFILALGGTRRKNTGAAAIENNARGHVPTANKPWEDNFPGDLRARACHFAIAG